MTSAILRDVAQSVEKTGKQVSESVWMDRFARAGSVAYGAVHLLLA